MSTIYDNWERLVAAVLKKEQLWQLFHDQSRSPSISSGSSDFSFTRLTSSLDDVPFSFSSPEWSASNQKEDDIGSKTAAAIPSSILVKDQSHVGKLLPNKHVISAPSRKRDLKIQVPKPQIQDRGFSRAPESSEYLPNISPRMTSLTPSSRVLPRAGGGHSESQTKWLDDTKQQSYPLPLPPAAISNSSHVSCPNSASKSPSAPLRSPERAENVKSPGTPWKKGKLLTRGPLGDVYLGFNSEKGEMCAMKEVSLSPDDADFKQNARMLEKEIALLSRIKHPNIVQYYGSEMVADNFYIYLEFISGGSIYMILREYGKLGESAIRSYTQQILSGLAYLHSKSIAHRDIKGANILVDPNGRVKLANFGTEKQIAGQSRTAWLMDSPFWTAPEVIMNSNLRNLTVDIWSLGCTVLEMATSKPPWSQYDRVTAMFKIANHTELPTIPDHLSDEGKDFLRHCFQWNPLHRATAFQLLEHPFVRSSSPLGKQILVSTSSGHPVVTNTVKSEGLIDHARILHQLDSGKLAIHSSRVSKSNLHSSDSYTPRNISAPVSPDRSHLLHPRSPQHMNGRLSPPFKSVSRTASSSSTPLAGGVGAILYPHLNRSMLPQETFPNLPNHSPNINSPSYWDPNILRGDLTSSGNDALRKQFGRAANGQLYEQLVLADRVLCFSNSSTPQGSSEVEPIS